MVTKFQILENVKALLSFQQQTIESLQVRQEEHQEMFKHILARLDSLEARITASKGGIKKSMAQEQTCQEDKEFQETSQKMEASTDQVTNQKRPIFDFLSKISCRVINVQLKVKQKTDEVYTQMTLFPEPNQDENIVEKVTPPRTVLRFRTFLKDKDKPPWSTFIVFGQLICINGIENGKEYTKLCRFPMNRIKPMVSEENPDLKIKHEALSLVNKATKKFLEWFYEDAYEIFIRNEDTTYLTARKFLQIPKSLDLVFIAIIAPSMLRRISLANRIQGDLEQKLRETNVSVVIGEEELEEVSGVVLEKTDFGSITGKGMDGSVAVVEGTLKPNGPADSDENVALDGGRHMENYSNSEIVKIGSSLGIVAGAASGGLSIPGNVGMDAGTTIEGKLVDNSTDLYNEFTRNNNGEIEKSPAGEDKSLGVHNQGNSTLRISNDDDSHRSSGHDGVYETCDIFDGRWVRDKSKPYYPAGSCPHIDKDFDCYIKGRPDDGYLKWSWRPNGYDIPRLNATDFLERREFKRRVSMLSDLREDYYQEGNYVHPRLKVPKAYQRALITWARWVDKNINSNRIQVFFKGYSVAHFRGGQWNSGGQCHKETEPIFNESYLAK